MCNDLAQTYFELGQHERAEELFEESETPDFQKVSFATPTSVIDRVMGPLKMVENE